MALSEVAPLPVTDCRVSASVPTTVIVRVASSVVTVFIPPPAIWTSVWYPFNDKT